LIKQLRAILSRLATKENILGAGEWRENRPVQFGVMEF